MSQINKIRITEIDPETRDAVTTEFADIDAAIEYLSEKKVKVAKIEETTDGSQATA